MSLTVNHTLPAIERDILYLHEELRKSQTEIAKIFGVSQPTINYRFKRAKARLEFLRQLPEVTLDEIQEVLTILKVRPLDIETTVLYIKTNSQSEVARLLNVSQGAVRYWLQRVLVEHLQKDVRENDLHKRVRTACSLLIKKPRILDPSQKAEINGFHHHEGKSLHYRLTSPPRIQGRMVFDHPIKILDGLYKMMSGKVVFISEDDIRVALDLESIDLIISWSI